MWKYGRDRWIGQRLNLRGNILLRLKQGKRGSQTQEAGYLNFRFSFAQFNLFQPLRWSEAKGFDVSGFEIPSRILHNGVRLWEWMYAGTVKERTPWAWHNHTWEIEYSTCRHFAHTIIQTVHQEDFDLPEKESEKISRTNLRSHQSFNSFHCPTPGNGILDWFVSTLLSEENK